MKKTKNAKAVFQLFKSFKKFIPQILLICFCSAAISLLLILLALLSKNVLEIAASQREGSILPYAILFAAVIIIQVLLSAASSLLRANVSGRFTNALREQLFKSLIKKKYSALSSYHSGDLLNRFTSDTDVIVSNTVSLLPDICSVLTKIIGGTAALLLLEWKLAVLVLIFGIMVPAIGRVINKKYKFLHKECHRSEGVTRSFLQECFENSIVIKTFKSEEPITNRLKLYMKENFNLKLKRALLSVFSHLSLYSFFTIGYYAILIWGAFKISEGSITFGMLTAFLQLVAQLRAPLQNISSIFPKYYAIIASAERLIEFEELDNEITSPDLALPCFEKLTGNNINFSFNNQKPILSDFNFKITKGSMTAITGSSGSGKSTLFKLILALYEPTSGSITINENQIVDANTRKLFAYVPQGNMILSGSILDNITLFNPDIPLNEVIKACKTAEIHEYIDSLENGYDTLLTERGGGLSEGQVQRLAIARALLVDTPVLLLDEATSALDQQTELKVLENIKSLKTKTVLLVTHRKAGIDFCDNIINI